VANNLNDISHDNPLVTLAVLQSWQGQDIKNFPYILNQALRTLVKQGHPQALEMLGFSSDPAIQVGKLFMETNTISIGENLVFKFEVISCAENSQWLMIDYIIHHQRSKGQLIPKVFKLKKKEIQAGETIQFIKKHGFQEVTTRRYYPGLHKLDIQINGKVYAHTDFILTGKKI